MFFTPRAAVRDSMVLGMEMWVLPQRSLCLGWAALQPAAIAPGHPFTLGRASTNKWLTAGISSWPPPAGAAPLLPESILFSPEACPWEHASRRTRGARLPECRVDSLMPRPLPLACLAVVRCVCFHSHFAPLPPPCPSARPHLSALMH